jgi:excisionase family DNA binding protein
VSEPLLPGSTRATVSVEEAGQILGIGRSAAYEAAKTGQLPTIRIGRRVLVPLPMLKRLLEVGQAKDTMGFLVTSRRSSTSGSSLRSLWTVFKGAAASLSEARQKALQARKLRWEEFDTSKAEGLQGDRQ